MNCSKSLFNSKGIFLLFTIYLILVLSTPLSFAGYNRYSPINYYDKTSGLYYRSIWTKGVSGGFLSSKMDRRHISNIFIYNPATNKSHKLFAKDNNTRHISFMVHEKSYMTKPLMNTEGHFIEFHTYGSFQVMNNQNLTQRPLKNHILLGIYLAKTKQTELWHCQKDGSALEKLITVPSGASWHIDLKANKVRVLIPDQKAGFIVKNFNW